MMIPAPRNLIPATTAEAIRVGSAAALTACSETSPNAHAPKDTAA
jgi:hypothetical protein